MVRVDHVAPLIHVATDRGEAPLADDGTTDARSFAAFYAEEYRGVLAFATSLCRDLHAAEDLTQDAFIAAQRKWKVVQHFERPELWVRRVVANRSVSRWRRLGSDERRARRWAAQQEPFRDAAAHHESADIWSLVRLLPARQAQVIALTYLENRPLDDVATILGIGVETAKTHLQRGRAALAPRSNPRTRPRTCDEHRQRTPTRR